MRYSIFVHCMQMLTHILSQDTQWNDIDYMQSHQDFTLDRNNYQGLPDVVKYLHSNDQQYMMIIVCI